ncbi:ricin-type beta-trefoil lectin domain protein [Microlunatus soli]|uniref:Ricin-type beta-trefoil lectin domain-containing protein n=1 Tax=Microlunatus soli TaxID=630515 RepID=A0A1H1PZ46_9ACTN|nr:ricin-type beta-trefoil lectin domain protein [Microlunatus soli]SDS16247.1 Ricin-type beta-trefoil lectin domain-containing protein [Microlunatus soli]
MATAAPDRPAPSTRRYRRAPRHRDRRLPILLSAICLLVAILTPLSTTGASAAPDPRVPLAGVPDGDLGQTPGSYAYYGFDQPSVDNLHWTQKITTDPGQANVFWSNQFTFDNDWTGYTGFQSHRDGLGMFLVSIWNSTDSRTGSPGTYCITFSEDGTGRGCRLDVSPIAGHSYRWDVSSDAGGWYTFTITDETAGTSFTLGSIKVGAGVGMDTSRFVAWTEYFDWNDPQATCLDEPSSRLAMSTPTSRTTSGPLTATWTKSRVSDGCATQATVRFDDAGAIQRDGIGNSAAGRITNPGGLCLAGGTSATSLTLQGCDNSMVQQWNRGADGTLRADWRCLTPRGNKAPYGTSLDTCRSIQAQGFRAKDDGTIVNPTTSTCLQADDNAVGAKVTLVACDPSAIDQHWKTPARMVR